MKKLQLSDVRLEIPFTFNKGISLGSIAKLKRTDFNFDVYLEHHGIYLQRDLVWTELQKSELILSILKGIKIPPVSIVQYDHNDNSKELFVIDGKQRLTTIIDFINNEFPVIFKAESYYFTDLDDYAKRTVNLYNIVADVVYDDDSVKLSLKEKEAYFIKWFLQINFSGTPQEVKHQQKLEQSLEKID